ncbi:hypothetical protein V8N76_004577 [Salmonella enterica]
MILTIDRPNLLSALDARAPDKEVRYYLRGLIFDTEKKLVATDGKIMFIGNFAEELADPIVIGFDHKPPTRFNTCELDTERGIARYIGTGGLAMAGGITIIDARACDWRRATRGNWTEPTGGAAPQLGINADYLGKICKMAARFSPHHGMTLRPGSDSTQALRIDFTGGPYAIIMPQRQ